MTLRELTLALWIAMCANFVERGAWLDLAFFFALPFLIRGLLVVEERIGGRRA